MEWSTVTLKPDETKCLKCERIFASGEAFVAHEGAYGKCIDPKTIPMMAQNTSFIWGFTGKDRTHKPRKSNAQAAFERVVAALPVTKQRSLATDIEKVKRVLERERDR